MKNNVIVVITVAIFLLSLNALAEATEFEKGLKTVEKGRWLQALKEFREWKKKNEEYDTNLSRYFMETLPEVF